MCEPEEESGGYVSESCCDFEEDSRHEDEESSEVLPGPWLAERAVPLLWPRQEQAKVQALLD